MINTSIPSLAQTTENVLPIFNFQDRARRIVSEYIKSAVLIDDDWPVNGQLAGSENADDIAASEEEFTGDPYEDEDQSSDGASDFFVPKKANAGTAYSNANRLVSIHESFIKKGIICTGFRYTAKEKATAPLLARNADILILDWNFAGDGGQGAIEILRNLKEDGQLRFVCVFTDQPDLHTIKNKIYFDLYDITLKDEGELDFKVGSFVFTLRNKAVKDIDSKHQSSEESLFDDAVAHIALHYSGFLQLSMLEMTSRHRNTMLSHLTRFSRNFDAAILSDSSQEGSPVSLAENLRTLLLDEWRIALEASAKKTDMWILGEKGRAAYASSLKINLPSINADFLFSCATAMGAEVKIAQMQELFCRLPDVEKNPRKFDVVVGKWLDAGAQGNSLSEGFSKKNLQKLTLATLYALSHPDLAGGAVTSEKIWWDVLKLDALFHQQQILPEEITQGTILKYDDENYFICITPLCDTARLPKGYHSYTFLSAKKAKTEEILTRAPDYCIFVEADEPVCLHVDIKRPYVFEINEISRKLSTGGENLVNARYRLLPMFAPVKVAVPPPQPTVVAPSSTAMSPVAAPPIAIEEIAALETNNEGAHSTLIKFRAVGQLRSDFFLMLSAASASNAARVGVNRVEFIRSHKS